MDKAADRSVNINKRLRVLIIDDNVVPLTLAVIRCLGIADHADIHVLNLNNLYIPAFRFSKYVSSYTRIKADSDEQVAIAIRQTCGEVKADIIVPIKEKTVRIVAEHCADLLAFTRVPPMPDPSILEVVRNKWLLYNWLFDNGFTTDRSFTLPDVLASNEKLNQLVYPVLIKPFWGSGGRGITLIKDREALLKYKPGKNFNREELLIQPYIDGNDIDISAIIENGEILAYTIQKDISGNKELVYSKAIEFLHDKPLLEYAARIFRELKYTGIAHLDFKYDEHAQTFKLIDFNARFWSSLLGSLHAGINFPWLYCQRAFNHSIGLPDFREEKYYVTNNCLKSLFCGISVGQTEIQYSLKDPIPLIFDLGQRISYQVRKVLQIK